MIRTTAIVAMGATGLFAWEPLTTIAPEAAATREATAADKRTASGNQWQEGAEYDVVDSAPQLSSVLRRAQVLEFFRYDCGHCYQLELPLVRWYQGTAQRVDLVRVPVTWGAPGKSYARLYYSLQRLGRGDLHDEVFTAVRTRPDKLFARDAAQNLRLLLAFARAQGVDAKALESAWNSDAVLHDMRRADELAKHYRLEGVPTLIVNGRYKTDLARVGADAEVLIALVDDLVSGRGRR